MCKITVLAICKAGKVTQCTSLDEKHVLVV